jgi:diguanylate cyclase (GGDEF)-like protein
MRETMTPGAAGRQRTAAQWWSWPVATLVIVAVWLIAYGAAVMLAYNAVTSLWFPPTAVSYAAFAVFRRGAWPGLILANLVAAQVSFSQAGLELDPLHALLYGSLFALTHCGAYWSAAAVTLQSIPRNAPPSLARTVGVFILGGIAAALMASVSGVWVSTMAGLAPKTGSASMILPWLIGDVAGLVALGPLLLLVFRMLASQLRVPIPHRLHAFDDLPRPPRNPGVFALKLLLVLGAASLSLLAIARAPDNEPLLFIVYAAIMLQLWIVHTQGAVESLVSIALFNLAIVALVFGLRLEAHALTLQFAMITLAVGSYYGLAVPMLHADNAQLRRLLIQDALTGAYNRHFFLELSQQAIRQSRMREQQASMLMLDLDNLKHINDRYGHAAGDQALSQIAHVCRGALSANDVLGRLGGDEFGVLLPAMGHAEAAQVAQRLLAAVRASVYSFSDDIRPSMSIGIATTQSDTDDYDSLWMRADSALYVAKRGGRDRIAQEEAPFAEPA